MNVTIDMYMCMLRHMHVTSYIQRLEIRVYRKKTTHKDTEKKLALSAISSELATDFESLFQNAIRTQPKRKLSSLSAQVPKDQLDRAAF